MTRKQSNLNACPEYADRLVDLSDGELLPADRAIVEAHVADCPGCRGELRLLNSSLAHVVGTLGAPLLSPGIHAGSRPPGLEAGDKRAADGTRSVPTTTWAAAAVALACLLLLSFGLWQWTRPRALPKVATAPPATLSEPEVSTHSPPLPEPALDEAAALRQIALIEEQARLETWLELMPTGREYDQLRATNEALLVRFRDASDDVPANRSSRLLEETL